MQPEQSVSQMAEEVLLRQAKVLAQRSGYSLEEARQAISDTEAGRQLRNLARGRASPREGPGLAGERLLGACRATMDAPHWIGGPLALCSRTPLNSQLERGTWRGWEAEERALRKALVE